MMRLIFAALLPAVLCAAPVMGAAEEASDSAIAEAITDYMDFATDSQGAILPTQIDEAVFASAQFVDVRPMQAYEAGHIPGAIRIDWREIPARLDELRQDGPVILYCQTGVLSAQSMLAARLMGRDNVLVMQGGFAAWQSGAAWKPD